MPVLEKLFVEELTETNPYQKFNQSLDKVFENVEDMDLSLDVGKYSSEEIPLLSFSKKY